MSRGYKFGIGGVLLAGALAYLMYAGVEQGSMYYFTVEEFQGRKAELANEGVRVSGRVTAGSVQRRTSANGTELRFTLGDFVEGGAGDTAGVIPVEFSGIVPDMFAEGRDVIVEGKYAGGTLRARTVMTSCPSKYEPGSAQAQTDGRKPAAAK